MDQNLYNYAETAYQNYCIGNGDTAILLFSWLLAEVHFAGTVTEVQTTVLGALPKTDLEKTFVIETAKAYREFRQGIERAERVKPKGNRQAVRAKELYTPD